MIPAKATTLDEIELSDADFEFISRMIQGRTGIVLSQNKRRLLCQRLQQRLRIMGLKRVDDYCGLLRSQGGEGELVQLINAVTTNMTYFFREPHHFEHLRDHALPEILAQHGREKRLRLWSAGCSSGEEPYSIAMTIAGQMSQLRGWDVRILATDLDSDMVATGRIGCYPAEATESIPSKILAVSVERMNLPSGPLLQMRDTLRRLVSFKQLNLLEDWPMQGPFDAIFCRNVMIYFDNPTKANLIERFKQHIKPGGWLYIGHSESLTGAHPGLKLMGRTIYRRDA